MTVAIDTTPPAAPSITAPAPNQAVTADTVTVTGTSEPGAAIRITGGAAAAEGTADETGAFEIEAALTSNALNTLQVSAIDKAWNQSESATIAIIHSDRKPIIRLIGDSSFSLVQGQNFEDPGATVTSGVYGESGEPVVTGQVHTDIPGTYPIQ